MYFLMEAAAQAVKEPYQFPWAFTGVYVIGFIAAVAIGSIAWYNSKRPVGWEDKERPDFVPKVEKNPTPEVAEPKVEKNPTPEVAEPKVEKNPTPEVAEPKVEKAPTPEVAEPKAEKNPTPEVAEPKS